MLFSEKTDDGGDDDDDVVVDDDDDDDDVVVVVDDDDDGRYFCCCCCCCDTVCCDCHCNFYIIFVIPKCYGHPFRQIQWQFSMSPAIASKRSGFDAMTSVYPRKITHSEPQKMEVDASDERIPKGLAIAYVV